MRGFGRRMRATSHHGRIGTTKHNGRLFDLANAEHINIEKLGLNYYWFFDAAEMEARGVKRGAPEFMEQFEDAELRFYKQTFGKSLQMQNERYKAQRHPERCRTVEQILQTKNKSPVETILQIGDLHNYIKPEDFQACVMDYLDRLMEWGENNGGCYQPIDLAIHFDEKSPHAHLRGTFVWYDDDGIAHMGQDEALKRAGIELPDPDKKRGQYNNRKMSFDRMLREWWIEIAEAHGYQIEREPIKGAEHLTVKEYKAKRDVEKAARETAALLDARAREVQAREKAVAEQAAQVEARERAVAEQAARLAQQERAIEEKAEQLERRERAIQTRAAQVDERAKDIQKRAAEVESRKTALDKAFEQVRGLIRRLEERYQRYGEKLKEWAEEEKPLASWAKRKRFKDMNLTVWDLFEQDMERHQEKRRRMDREAAENRIREIESFFGGLSQSGSGMDLDL